MYLMLYVFLTFDFCRFCVINLFFHPRHNGQWPPTPKDFHPRCYPLHFCLIFILQKEPVFPFLMLSAKQGNYRYHYITFVVLSLFFRKSQYFPFEYLVLNKGTTGTIFITSLVWCGPWLGIEPETSRTRSQHSTTRLSRRRLFAVVNM